MKKKVFYEELAYIFGLIILTMGVALMEKADFGVSMVVAPAYLFSLRFSFMSFGMAEYLLQAVLLIIMCLALRRFRAQYLFSFVTAVIYGFILDGVMLIAVFLPVEALVLRIVWYVLGVVLCSVGIALLIKTYLPPEVYELIVKEVSKKYSFKVSKVKTVYDIASLLTAVGLSFLLLGKLEGVGIGTIVCALVNGFIIGLITRIIDKLFVFRPLFKKVKDFFEKST